jgi:Bacterial phosphonate metabolism protein (PhnI)
MVRFVIITVPPPELSVLLESTRAAAASLTRSCAALAYPPHITLRTGAVVPEESVESFASGLLLMEGPGIKGETRIGVEGLGPNWVALRAQRCAEYPLVSTCTSWTGRADWWESPEPRDSRKAADMGYVAVRGGAEAIEASIERLHFERIRSGVIPSPAQVREGMRRLVEQVMSEASLYDEDAAALAVAQAESSPTIPCCTAWISRILAARPTCG